MGEASNKYNDLAIITSTLYKADEVSVLRSELAIKTLELISQMGINCVVLDGGSNDIFIKQIENLPNIVLVVNKELGMGESRREALKIAIDQFPGSQYFLWLEPEKYDLLREENLGAMLEDLRSGKTDIIVPKRKNMEQYPKFQQWIEQRANKRVAEKTGTTDIEGETLDLWFGPKLFNKEGAQYFLNYQLPPKHLDKWDSIIAPVVDAKREGLRIKSVDVDFDYPDEQREQEEGNRQFDAKRVEQYQKILPETGDEYWINRINPR